MNKYFLIIVAFFVMQLSYSQNNWDSDNPLGNFTFCNNWFADACPPTWNSTTDLNIQFRNNLSQTTMYLDYGTWKDVNNITYFATYTSSVTQFDADGPVGNENGINFYGKFENYSPNLTQVFNLPFHGKNATQIELNPINGGLTFNRPIYNSGNKPFRVYGPNSKKLTINQTSYPQGNGTVTFSIEEASIVEVDYSNVLALSGGYFVKAGELWINSNAVLQGGIQVGNGTAANAKLYISNLSTATTVANAITVLASSTNATIGSLNSSNTHTYSGTINLNNNDVNLDVVAAGGNNNFTNVISGTGGIKKIGFGLTRLSASNTYSGNTVVTQGTLQYGTANAISNSSNVILNGGKYSTGAAAGFSDIVGTVALTSNSTIELGTGNHILTFAASNAVAWTAGTTLTITGWTNSCTGAKVFVGNNNTGLTATQLAQITFQGYLPGAGISTTGELIPGNAVLTATGGTLLGNYATMTAAFAAINAGTHTGVLTISVLNDINEGANTAILNNVPAMTSLLIQPAGCAARTITGTGTGGLGTPLIDFNGADFVTVDGLNAGLNSLTISNTSTSNTTNTCTIRFQTDATNNTITNCSVLGSATMASGTAGGNIWFGANSALTGNDNITVSNCNIGPAGVNLSTKGICFTGTPGFENSGIAISNNNIYDYFSSTVASAGIDLATIGSNTVSITNNRFYQTATRTLNAAAIHSAIRIANTGATNGFTISGNTIGYASSAGTGTYNFTGTVTGAVFNPINLTLGSTASNSVQNNTIAGIVHATSFAGFFSLFNAINVTAGAVNIGTITGNTIGLAAAPITFNATAGFGGGTITGVNSVSNATVNIQNNTIQSISSSGVATAAFDFNGVNVTGAGAYTINNNTIGSGTANSISLGTLGVSNTLSNFRGINSAATGNLIVGSVGLPNIIQNITLNAVAINSFTGVQTTGANASTAISYNTIRDIRITGAANGSTFTGISNSGAVTGAITINNNSFGTGSSLVTYTAANSGNIRVITNTGGAAAASLSIQNNDITGITHSVAGTSTHTYILNGALTLSQNISSNTFTNLNVNTGGAVTFLSNGVSLAAGGTKNVNSNSIAGTFNKGGTGALTLYSDNASSIAGTTVNNLNNNFSNITVAGVSLVTGWQNFDGGSPTKTITGNTFNNWILGSTNVTVLNVNFLGGACSVSNNTISNIGSSGNITGLSISNSSVAGTTLNANSNTITNLISSGAGAVIGLNNAQPATTTTNNSNSNSITGLSSVSGIVTAIDNSSASTTKAISTNTIGTLSSTSNIVSAIISANGGTVSITNNPISILTTAFNGALRGIYVSTLGTTNAITGNTINGMTNSSAGATALVRAIEVAGANPANINSNTITSISSSTTNPGTGTSSAVVGIYFGSSNAGGTSTISSNTINALGTTTVGAINVTAAAILTSSTAANGTISKNTIYGITNTSTGATNVSVGFLPNGGGWTFANNMISLISTNAVQALGVYDTGATGARKYYYNSIYVDGNHAGTQVSVAFQFNNVTGTADVKNNIFSMQRTSGAKNYAIANSSATFTNFITNYNVLNASVASTIGLVNGVDQTFGTWKTASSGDANSYSNIVVPFINTAIANLHITAGCSDLESGGTVVVVTDDYDAAARSGTTPDIGADEFAGTVPALITLTADAAICSGNSIALNATSTDLTYTYTWNPTTSLAPTTGPSVTASPVATITYTVTGTSPTGCVKTKDVTITVNPLPTAITVTPSSVNLCANTIQTFIASPVSTSKITIGSPNSNIATVNTTPYRQASSTQLRMQYLITKTELNAAGITVAGNILSLAFNVTSVGTNAMPTYDISMANTAAASLTTTYLTTGFTTVYNGINILPVAGINTHTFSIPFAWDGTSNIVINICHTGTGTGLNPYSLVTLCTPATTSNISRTGGSSCTTATGTTSTDKPIIILEVENPITWSPVTNLYTNVAATIPYNATTYPNLTTVYSKPTAPIVYTATVTNPGSGCFRTSTGTITMTSSTWNGVSWSPATPTGNTSLVFTGNYSSSGNLSGCSCSVTSGNVIFNTPDTLTLINGLTVAAGPTATLKFNNNASLLQTNDAATNSGSVTIERITQPMYRFDYTYWGSPVSLASNFTLGVFPGGLSPETLSDKFYSWIPTVANAGGTWAQESATTVMNPIKGYIVRAPSTFSFNPLIKVPYTANIVGVPNNGIVSSPIYHGALALAVNDDKYNLLGNPYPSALDAQAFLTYASNTPIIDGTIYFWTHNSPISASNPNPFYGSYALNYNNNDYAAWNSLGIVGSRGIQAGTGGVTPNGFIASGQGFFTKSTGTALTGATVTFNNSMRVAGNNNQFFRTVNPSVTNHSDSENTTTDKHRIWIDLINNSGDFSQILVGYKADATLGWDRMYDGVPIDESGTLLYSLIPDRKLIIQGRPLPFNEEDQVRLGFKSTHQDTYTFGLDAVDGLFENQNIYIEDRTLNIIHDLKMNPYVFTSEVGVFNDRFVLRYTNAALHNSDFNFNQIVNAFISNHQLNAESSESIQSIEVYDIAGKWITTFTPKEKSPEFKVDFNYANGVYLAKIKLESGVVLTKKLIH